jgi:hypothetical protein
VVEFAVVENKKKSMGAIDALASGFDLIRRRPWLPVLPVLLNLGLWLGPRISVAPLAERLARYLLAAQSSSPTLAQLAQTQADLIRQWGSGFNLLSLLASSLMGMTSVVAALVGGRTGAGSLIDTGPKGALAAPITLSNTWGVVGMSVGLVAAGLLLAALFLGMIAQAIRGERFSLAALAPRTARSWLRLMLLTLLVPVALVIVGLPLTLLAGFVTLITLQGALFIVSVGAWFLMMLAVWAMVYLYFTIDAILLDDVPVRQAVWRSFNVVRRGFGATALLILLVALLGAGLSVVWRTISGGVVGTGIAIIGNSFIGASLAAASLFFYQQRRAEWARIVEEVRARLQQTQGAPADPDAGIRH